MGTTQIHGPTARTYRSNIAGLDAEDDSGNAVLTTSVIVDLNYPMRKSFENVVKPRTHPLAATEPGQRCKPRPFRDPLLPPNTDFE
jgi:hypothetical protein